MDKVCHKIDCHFLDLYDEIMDELNPYISIMNYYRDTRWQQEPICRIMTPYPMASEHRARTSNPQFYTPEKNGMTEETTDFIAYTIRYVWSKPNSMIFMKSKFEKPVAHVFKSLIQRIRNEVNNNELTQIEMCLVWKSPQFLLKHHKDKVHDWQKSAVRYHFILKSNDENCMYSGDDPNNMIEYKMKVGEVWALDTAEFHKACNNSKTEDSLHFIIDFIA